MIRVFLAASCLIASVLSACGGTVCQPDRCGSGQVCSLSGTCEPAPASGGDEELVIIDEDAPLPRAYEVSCHAWGTSDGEHADEVRLGGENGVTLYLAFPLDSAEVGTAVLELQPSEDTTYGAPQTLEVWDVTPFESVDARRLPGARFERHRRRSVWQSRYRIDVSAMAQAADETLYLAVRAQGDAPGWRIATPGAATSALRPRLMVHGVSVEPSVAESNAPEPSEGPVAATPESDATPRR